MFDMGAPIYERPACFKLWPTEGNLVALVDADLLPYIVGYTTDEVNYAKALDRVAQGEYSTVAETPECEDAIDHLDWMVNDWVQGAGADAALLYITESAKNFRLSVCFTQEYKGQRVEEKPPFFNELKLHLEEKHRAIVARGEEADDLIVTEMHARHKNLVDQGAELGSPEHRKFSDVVAVSSDKDLRICPGWHYNPTTKERVWVDVLGWLEPVYGVKEVVNYEYWPLVNGEPVHPDSKEAAGADKFTRGKHKGEVKTKRIKRGLVETQYMKKLGGAGLKFFYAQILMGDGADNYPGLPGVGMTRAFEVLNSCKTEEEMYAKVLEEYRKVYGEDHLASNYRGGSLRLTAEQLMTEQGRLAHMQREPGEVWNPGITLPSGEDEAWKS